MTSSIRDRFSSAGRVRKLAQGVRSSGFTLIELLVVMAIIAVLLALITPMVGRAMRAGQRTRQASDLQMIATALTAYHQDFKAYPQVNRDGEGPQILGRALLGPEPAGDPRNPNYSSTPHDGQDGYGFRTRAAVNGVAQGRVYGPYLNPDHFKTAPDPSYAILDSFGQPILYYPTLKGTQFTTNQPGKYIDNWHHPLPSESPNNNPRPYINSADCFGPTVDTQFCPPAALDRILWLDRAANGGAGAFTNQPPQGVDYVLVSAGPDEKFGPQDPKHPDQFDDVTNLPTTPK